jgi:hypothetical protein
VGEATSGGDFHGLLANNTSVITNSAAVEEWAKTTVEVHLEHSKTGHSRYINMAGITVESKLETAEAIRDCWWDSGIQTSTSEEGELLIERPDFWVVKVTMLGMEEPEFDVFLQWLAHPERSSGVSKYAKDSIAYAKMRYKPRGVLSQAKKHVHIAGGRAASSVVRKALKETKQFLRELKEGDGFRGLTAAQAEAMVSVVPGPLLVSSQHRLMGLQPSSTYETMKELLTDACLEVGTADPHLSLQQRAVAKWTNHSLRRGADTTARRTKLIELFGREVVTIEEIDLYFGWHEEEMSKDMQIHYSTLTLRERLKQARITCMT